MADEATPNPTPSAEPAGDGGTGGGTQAPEGFVPLADLEREQARARSFQSELDRARAQLASAPKAPAAKDEPASGTPTGFDPDEFRRSLMNDVLGAQRLVASIADLKTQFPHADPALFDRAAEFGNPDALRLAVEDSHTRVAAILDSEKQAIEARLREEMGGKIGGGTPAGAAPGTPAGDPSVEQLLTMDIGALHAFKVANPGVAERVLRSAT